MLKPLKVVGMGPGGIDYISDAAKKAIHDAEVIAAGRRHMLTLDRLGEIKQERIPIDGNLTFALGRIEKEIRDNKDVVVCVSGDPGYFSLLEYLKKNLNQVNQVYSNCKNESINIEVIPGISSLSYFFSKLACSYQDAAFYSLHGRDVDVRGEIMNHPVTAFLTDRNHGVNYIASAAKDLDVEIIVGENLSYPDEKISYLTPESARRYVQGDLCAVIVKRHEFL